MNVNGARFDLLLGREDFGRCLDGDGAHALTLASWWDANVLPTEVPAWDGDREELAIPPVLIELPRTPGEAQLTLDARRGAAADRFGNVYWIGPTRRTLHVSAARSRRDARIWPQEADPCAEPRAEERLDFAPVTEEAAPADESYLALAVTEDDYLVVAFTAEGSRGFLTFDLVAGGPPTRTLWPGTSAFAPIDMAARRGGGVWVLDRTDGAASRLLWELDCRLSVITTGQVETAIEAEEPDVFQPVSGTPHAHPAPTFPGGLELLAGRDWVVEPIAVEAIGAGVVLLLDRDDAVGRSRVVRLKRSGDVWSVEASRWLDELPDQAHDFVHARARLFAHIEADAYLLIATSSGNQARAFTLGSDDDELEVEAATELLPLRRFGGRALVSIRGDASYDSGIDAPLWTPVVHQPRSRFAASAEFITPVFDSRDLGTTWDRVLLDACIPPGTAVDVESRAGDELMDAADSPHGAAQVVGLWLPEPRPYLRGAGAELPWLRHEAARSTRRETGVGTWELLLQQARGRYLQLRIRLSTDSGIATPRLRALRVWSPRFSYPQRFLPGVYREDTTSASLLERWLANCESTLTQIEDRIVNVQSLFDPRTAPADALEWLGEWLDVALDPAWDERRRRIFIRYAMEFFRWRGTVHGLSLALELAFDECFDSSAFDTPERGEETRRIRIVEAFQTRRIGALAAGDPGSGASVDTGPREVVRTEQWTPAEGNAGLVDRYAEISSTTPTATMYGMPFPLYGGEGGSASREEFFQSALGFVPAVGAEERRRWQEYHRAQYGTPAALLDEHGVAYDSFDEVDLPRDWPTPDGYAEDWRSFTALSDGARVRSRWSDFLARRYRRIERLNSAWGTAWPDFDVVALPDVLPARTAAMTDWLHFERVLLPIERSAHRFSVLLPVADVSAPPHVQEARLGLAQRIVELEKPAHTVFDVRFYWALFRIDEARLDFDTRIGAGSRAPELIPAAILGRAYMGASFVGGADRPRDEDRLLLTC